MHHEEAGIIIEPGAKRQSAGLDYGLIGLHRRSRHVDVVQAEVVRPRTQADSRIEILYYLEVVDVNMNRVLVIVMVNELPFLHRIQAWLDERHVGESCTIKGVDERFRVRRGRHVVEESAGDEDLSLDVGLGISEIDKGCIRAKLLPFDE